MHSDQVNIRFWLDEKEFGARTWPQVPRVGDEVMLGPFIKGKIRQAYRVLRVCWGVEGENEFLTQCVNVEIEKVKD